jgi:hypothetical protein
MDKLENYRQIIQQTVNHHAQYIPSHGQIKSIPIIDTVHDNYLLMDIGWNYNKRVHDVIFHLRIEEGKIWIEWDGVETGIAQDLIEAGIPKEDIILALFQQPPISKQA